MKVITTWKDVPPFDNEEDEAVFWAESRLEVRLMNASLLKADTRESTTITLRLPAAARAHQAHRPLALPELPEHDQTVAERAAGKGNVSGGAARVTSP